MWSFLHNSMKAREMSDLELDFSPGKWVTETQIQKFCAPTTLTSGPEPQHTPELRPAGSLYIDLLAEVARFLTPRELLHIARSTRAFRHTLMSKRSKPIWKASEEASGVPKCPPELSSPQYASFLFDKFCMDCGGSPHRKIMILSCKLRVRLCDDCFRMSVLPGYAIREELSIPYYVKIYELAPANGYLYTRINLTEAAFRESLRGVLKFLDDRSYYKPAVKAGLERYRRASAEERKKIRDDSFDFMYENEKFDRTVCTWLKAEADRKEQENNRLCSIHKESIHGRLLMMGYSNLDLISPWDDIDWKWDGMVNLPVKPTEEGFFKLLPKLDAIIRQRRAERERRKRDEIVKARKANLVRIIESYLQEDENRVVYVDMEQIFRLPDVSAALFDDGPGTRISKELCTIVREEIVKCLDVGVRMPRD